MDFEYDPIKSEQNKNKHGIDFEHAQRLWEDIDRIETPAKDLNERRYALVALYNGKLWTAIFTCRNDRVRLISVRRSRTEEQRLYYES
ncbi:MAG: BrnT family toxin [Chloroflexi bacterium]|nr:BrnT family toxin [Chloroflexota bacterium]